MILSEFISFSEQKTSTQWNLPLQGGSNSYKVELTFTIDLLMLFTGQSYIFHRGNLILFAGAILYFSQGMPYLNADLQFSFLPDMYGA